MDGDISNAQKSTDTGLQEIADWAASLSSLGDMLLDQYEQTGKPEDLEQAISNTRRAIDITPLQEQESLAYRFSSLGDMLLSRYERTGKVEDLETAISNTQKAIDITPQDHPNLAAMFNSMGDMISGRYERTGNAKDLEDAIKIAREVLAMTSPDDPDMAAVFNNLGSKLLSQYKRTGTIGFLHEAIDCMQKAMDATSECHPHLASISSNLASMLLNRFKRFGDTEDLEIGIGHMEKAIRITPQDDPQLASRLSYLGNILSTRQRRTGNPEDLEKAITAMKKAVDLTPMDHPNLAVFLSSLGTILSSRYEQTGSTKDLEDAVKTAQDAIHATPQDHSNMPAMLNSLSNKLSTLYVRTGNINTLNQAIDNVQKAIDMTPQNHPGMGTRLSSLGVKIATRYERTGIIGDLEEGIQAMHGAVNATPQDHPDLFNKYNNLGNMLLRCYQRTGDTRDLHESVSNIRRGLDTIPQDHSDLAALLSNLGSGLSTCYERTKISRYLDEAIEVTQRVVQMMPETATSLASRLMNLGADLQRRFEQTGKTEDLDKAMRHTRRAIDATPQGHPDLAARLNNLGIMQFFQHKQSRKAEDLEQAIETVKKAVNITPEDHAGMASRLNNLGRMYSWRYETSGLAQDADSAIKIYETTFNSVNGVPLERITAALQGLQLLVKRGNRKHANILASKAVELLPQVCSRYLSYEDQQHAISVIASLAADACSLCLGIEGDPDRALEILEHGRGLIIGYLIDGHGDIAELRKRYPEKALELDSLRYKAFMSVDDNEPSIIRLQLLSERRESARELEHCIQDIRRLPGQDRFFLPPSREVLKRSASDGPIVVVNITTVSSDAIIVSASNIRTIPLPRMNGVEIHRYRPWTLTRCVRDAKIVGTVTDGDKFRNFLFSLWSDCVRLILEELGFCEPSNDQALPRIWWIGTGLASSLPFHAAGVHSVGSAENTLSRVISSYTPTIKALRHSRENAALHSDEHSVLVVTMRQTPGQTDLPGVEAEEEAVCSVFRHPHRVQSLKQPNKNTVLRNLGDFGIVHFACHGSSDLGDPSSSFLALQGDLNTVPDKLTVQEMANLNLGRAWLAYLSACSTAENNVPGLSDEVLHLASAFQVAGFGHVIASMWTSKDAICVQVASVFYRYLTKSSDTRWNNKAVAAALQAAVIEVRTQNPDKPYLWAQYIHTGA